MRAPVFVPHGDSETVVAGDHAEPRSHRSRDAGTTEVPRWDERESPLNLSGLDRHSIDNGFSVVSHWLTR